MLKRDLLIIIILLINIFVNAQQEITIGFDANKKPKFEGEISGIEIKQQDLDYIVEAEGGKIAVLDYNTLERTLQN
ncbi:hypothetical protein HY498_00455 [Candidatus Woesearchaeota archaeon]|nr:hypothetical protein [Candidatus Woesearchaeota archaeon]